MDKKTKKFLSQLYSIMYFNLIKVFLTTKNSKQAEPANSWQKKKFSL